MTEVAIIGATFYGNRGAEAMLSATIGELRQHRPELICNVFSYYPDNDRRLVSDDAVRVFPATPFYLVAVLGPAALLYAMLRLLHLGRAHRFLPASVPALAGSKVLICLAGVSFIDGREKFLPFNIATILPALFLGVPVVKFAQAVGPFRNPINRFAARIFLSKCQQVFARGGGTLANLKELFPTGTFYQRADDIAFLFKPEQSLSDCESSIESTLSCLKKLRISKRVVGLCPSIVVAKQRQKAGKNYAREMAGLVEAIMQKGHGVALFPNATRAEDMEKTHNNDLPLLAEIQDALDHSESRDLVSFSQPVNASQVHEIIRTCDIVTTSRFHAMIGALVCSKPVVVLGWSHKYREVLELFGQTDMAIDYKEVSIDRVVTSIESLLATREKRQQDIKNAIGRVQETARVQVEHALRLLKT